MTNHKYSTTLDGAKVVGRNLPISVKHSVEVCRFIKKKNLHVAKKQLQEVVKLKRAVPYLKYNWDLGHKRGMAAGRYPKKTVKEILTLLESIEVNAQFKGMNTSQLQIVHAAAHKASTPTHAGRHRGRSMKRTHVELIVQEGAPVKEKDAKPKKGAPKKQEKVDDKKKAPKKEEKRPAAKEETKAEVKTKKTQVAEEKKVEEKKKEENKQSESKENETKEVVSDNASNTGDTK